MLLLKRTEEDCTSSLVIEGFDDSDKVGADVILLHLHAKPCRKSPFVCEDLVEILLVVEIFLTEDS